MYYKSCFENYIKFINDLINDDIKYINDLTINDGSIYIYDELKAIYNVTISFPKYSGLVRSILSW